MAETPPKIQVVGVPCRLTCLTAFPCHNARHAAHFSFFDNLVELLGGAMQAHPRWRGSRQLPFSSIVPPIMWKDITLSLFDSMIHMEQGENMDSVKCLKESIALMENDSSESSIQVLYMTREVKVLTKILQQKRQESDDRKNGLRHNTETDRAGELT
jgi:hypothetical protein